MNKKTIKNNNYFVVNGWMVNELGLKGNELLIYSIIFGFTQDGKNWFEGSRNYLASFINCDVRTVCDILKKLVDKKLLIKETKTLENNTIFVRYKAYNPISFEDGDTYIDVDWLDKNKKI